MILTPLNPYWKLVDKLINSDDAPWNEQLTMSFIFLFIILLLGQANA